MAKLWFVIFYRGRHFYIQNYDTITNTLDKEQTQTLTEITTIVSTSAADSMVLHPQKMTILQSIAFRLGL